MNTKLCFRHIKQNILKYTVAFSAAVHLIGILLFPSWGTVPDLLKEKVIKIKLVVENSETPIEKKPPEPENENRRELDKPEMVPESTTPQVRRKTSLVKSAKAVIPPSIVKKIPVQTEFPKQISKPVQAIQKDLSHQHQVASLQRMVEIETSAELPPSPRWEQTETPLVASSAALRESKFSDSFKYIALASTYSPVRPVIPASGIASPDPTVSKRNVTQVAMIDRPKKPGATFSTAKEIFPTQFSVSKVKVATINRKINFNPLIRGQNIQPLNQNKPTTPTKGKSFASMVVSAPTAEIHVRFPGNLDSTIFIPGQRAIPVAVTVIEPLSRSTTFLQMASIPPGFSGESINGKGEIKDNQPSEQKNSAGENDGISADQMGKIKQAFSSQVRLKIAQSKYFPRLARKRGFEGQPVVAFTLGNTGNLLEVSINKSSPYKLLDEAAIDAVKSAGPYPPIPGLLKIKTIRFELPISFILEQP